MRKRCRVEAATLDSPAGVTERALFTSRERNDNDCIQWYYLMEINNSLRGLNKKQ